MKKIFAIAAIFTVIACHAAKPLPLNPFIIHPAPVKNKLDGKIDEWNDNSKITLNRWNWRIKTGKTVIYASDDDLSATVNIGWKKGYIVISAFIIDDSWHPGSNENPDAGDTVIIYIAPSNPIGNPPAAPYEIIIGGNPTATYIKLADDKYQEIPDALLGYVRAHAILNTEKTNVEEGKKPDEYLTKCWIETAIPVSELPGVILPNGLINFGITVRDDDGDGIRGELRWRGNKGELKSADGFAVGKFYMQNEDKNGQSLVKSTVTGGGSSGSSSTVAGTKK
ncbi:MAG: hypothetical protein WCO98_00355 [bacterium]